MVEIVSHYDLEIKDGQNSGVYSRHISDIVLLQFTGFVTDDGKEIYEGDIISVYMSAPWDDAVPVEYKGTVEFAEGRFCFGGIDSGEHNGPLNEVVGGSTLVIGNIYEDRDLLTK